MKRKITPLLTFLVFLTSMHLQLQVLYAGDRDLAYQYEEPAASSISTLEEPAASSVYTDTGSDGSRAYVVVPGDMMWKIARAHGITLKELIRLNPQIKNPDLIFPNQIIVVKAGMQ